MRSMKLFALFALTSPVVLAACASDSTPPVYRSALTGEECEPDPSTLVPGTRGSGRGGHNSPTGIPGDNIDDLRSGRTDCLYDGNSGHGDDREGCIPPPGCDAAGCCEEPTPEPDPDADAGTPDEPAPDLI